MNQSKLELQSTLDTIARLSVSPRPAGSEEDNAAEELVRSRLEGFPSYEIIRQQFHFKRFVVRNYKLEVDGEVRTCLPSLCSASTAKSGIHATLCRNDGKTDVAGKVVLVPIRTVHESIVVEELASKGALGAVIFQPKGPLLVSRVKYPVSSVPSISVEATLGNKLWNLVIKRKIPVEILVQATTEPCTGTNILSLPKSKKTQTLFVAHRDSRIFSPGAIDNASGTALGIFASGLRNGVAHSFLSSDAEEYGLIGSSHFLEVQGFFIAGKTNVVNLDTIGQGSLHLISRSRGGPLSKRLNRSLTRVATKLEMKLSKVALPRGSDCDNFVKNGFEASWLRAFPSHTATTVEDTFQHVNPLVVESAQRLLREVIRSHL